MSLEYPIVGTFPPSHEIRLKRGDALREVELLRALLRVAERVDRYRKGDHMTEGPGRAKNERRPVDVGKQRGKERNS